MPLERFVVVGRVIVVCDMYIYENVIKQEYSFNRVDVFFDWLVCEVDWDVI